MSAKQTKTSTNFNTMEMKIAFIKHSVFKNGCLRLPSNSIENLSKALVRSVMVERDMTVVVVYDGYFIHDEDFAAIKSQLETFYNVEYIIALSDMFVFRTAKNKVVTVKLCGASSNHQNNKTNDMKRPVANTTENKKRRRPQSSEHYKNPTTKRSKEDDSGSETEGEAPGALTQECAGLY